MSYKLSFETLDNGWIMREEWAGGKSYAIQAKEIKGPELIARTVITPFGDYDFIIRPTRKVDDEA